MKKAQSSEHEFFMHRCLQLAALGAGRVAPNPMVGAVLVYDGRVIGEGYHQAFGGPHAEVNCINSVKDSDRHLIAASTLYVSLEPCSHHGKTPPCTDFILAHQVKRLVLASRDPHYAVAGKGVLQLKQAGVQVTEGVLEIQATHLNRRFIHFHTAHLPYVILKWAQTADGYLGRKGLRTHISNDFTDRLVHQWRSEEQGIMVGRNTVSTDDPELTVRLASGKNPIRIVIDPTLRLSADSKIFNSHSRTIVFNNLTNDQFGNVERVKLTTHENYPAQVLRYLHSQNILSVMVEGGAMLLNSFLDAGLWNEIRVIKSMHALGEDGICAPSLHFAPAEIKSVLSDVIETFYRR